MCFDPHPPPSPIFKFGKWGKGLLDLRKNLRFFIE